MGEQNEHNTQYRTMNGITLSLESNTQQTADNDELDERSSDRTKREP